MPTLHAQRPGLDGIRDTLYAMQRLVNAAYLDEVIRAQAAGAIRHCEKGNVRCQMASLLVFTRRKLHFVKDPLGVEGLRDPRLIAREVEAGRMAYGDCDDFSMYLASLMKAVGIPATFRAVGFRGGPPSHVYVVGPFNTKLDATRNEWAPALGELLPETSSLEQGV